MRCILLGLYIGARLGLPTDLGITADCTFGLVVGVAIPRRGARRGRVGKRGDLAIVEFPFLAYARRCLLREAEFM
ncbi:hypothetical protein F5Y11DRAFT_317954, partial [Daldinia sp. FL1419]